MTADDAGGLRAAAQALIDYITPDAVIDGEHGVRVVSRSSELVVALRAALASPAPTLDRERLARALHGIEDKQGIRWLGGADDDPYAIEAAAIADAYEADDA